jgi:hypothetical protein
MVSQVTNWSMVFPIAAAGFDHRSGHMGFMVGEIALRQAFSEYFFFRCQFSFHGFLLIHLSSGTMGPVVSGVPSWFSLNPLHEIKKGSVLWSWHSSRNCCLLWNPKFGKGQSSNGNLGNRFTQGKEPPPQFRSESPLGSGNGSEMERYC